MPARRSIIGRSLAGYLAAVCIVSLPTSLLAQVEGRKCVCTSKACKEAGVDTCKTRFFCYTERILTTGQEVGESTVTRGCTEGATPLLCETKSWITRSRSVNSVEPPAGGPRGSIFVPWPKLKCCDNRDYCNAADDDDGDDDDGDDDDDDEGKMRERKMQTERTRSAMDREMLDGPANRDATSTEVQPDRKYDDSDGESVVRLVRDRVRALHVAALVLAIAALISVLASCYVVTRSADLFLYLIYIYERKIQSFTNTLIYIHRLRECLFSIKSQYRVISLHFPRLKNTKIASKNTK